MYLETTQRASTQTDQRKTLQTEGTWGKLGTRLKLQRAEHHSGIQNIKYPVLGSVLGVTSESQSNRGSGQPAEQNMLPQSSWGGVSLPCSPQGWYQLSDFTNQPGAPHSMKAGDKLAAQFAARTS